MTDYFPSAPIEVLSPEDDQDVEDSKNFDWTSLILDEIKKAPVTGEAYMPVEKNAEEYNMQHGYRGKAVIFNQKMFKTNLRLSTRKGTDEDRDNLAETLKNLDFEVEIYDDLDYTKFMRKLEQLSAEDHSDRDCLLLAVFSHGIPNRIYAYDTTYDQNDLFDPFTAERCPTLAGKPKIFLIQACQGDQLDGGTIMRSRKVLPSSAEFTETDSAPARDTYTIPNRADFLMVFSTVPGYYSWRNQSQGSWFIQSICKIFKKHGPNRDLLSMITAASRNVALNFESFVPGSDEMDHKKQIPYMTSTLIREVYFAPKTPGACMGRILNGPNFSVETTIIPQSTTDGGIDFLRSSLVRPTTKPFTRPKTSDSADSSDLGINSFLDLNDQGKKERKLSNASAGSGRHTLVNPFDVNKDKAELGQ